MVVSLEARPSKFSKVPRLLGSQGIDNITLPVVRVIVLGCCSDLYVTCY